MNIFNNILALLLVSSVVSAQVNTDQTVISSSGSSYIGTNVQMDISIGEIAITTHSANAVQLTQGFQQSYTLLEKDHALATSVNSDGSENETSTEDLARNKLDDQLLENVILYPNPNDGAFHLQIESSAEEKATISIKDIKGRLIFAEELNLYDGRNLLFYNFGYVEKGMYLLLIESATNNKTIKILID